jgi:hypothetical protein
LVQSENLPPFNKAVHPLFDIDFNALPYFLISSLLLFLSKASFAYMAFLFECQYFSSDNLNDL